MAKRRKILTRTALCLAVGAFAVAVSIAIRVADPAPIASLRDQTFDFFQRLTPRTYGDLPVRVVDIDDASLSDIGQWPWPRTRVAALVRRLGELGAATVALDVILAEPDRTSPTRIADTLDLTSPQRQQELAAILSGLPDHDAVLADAIRGAPVVLGYASTEQANGSRPSRKSGYATAGANPATFLPPFAGAVTNLPILDAAAKGAGSLSLGPRNESGIVRRLPLVFTDGQQLYSGLVLEALRVAQGASSVTIRSTGASGENAGGKVATVDLRVGDFRVPLAAQGELMLYYDHNRPERYVSARDVLDPAQTERVRPLIEGQIVFVGASASGLLDQRVTSLGQVVPGVSIHAQAAEQILSQDFLRRPDWADGLETLATIAFCLLVSFLLLTLSARYAAAVITLVNAAILGGAWLAFTELRLLIDPVFAVLTASILYFAITAILYFTTDRDKRFVREAFGRYLAPELLAELEQSHDKLKLGGEIRDMTIMFMDVRDFTPISEVLTAEELIGFLNALFSPLTDAIQVERGTVDKYIGDSVMAFWNAPVSVPNHAAHACRAALQMAAVVDRMNAEDAFGFAGRGSPHLKVKIGIGLNTGEACVGNMGSERRFNYSVVGDAVNIAARIESSCKAVGVTVLVSEDTARAAPGFAFLEAGAVPLKGKSNAVKLFGLVGDEAHAATPAFRRLADEHARLIAAIAAQDRTKSLEALLSCRALSGKELAAFYEAFTKIIRDLPGLPEVSNDIPAIEAAAI
ncbi:MAG TPA: adenylate/guanylate cyclase domain-containing protein [Microvirga sp.]|jgi:adenylate cyclase|nr:adenylate/guanylate cyclase domain-containing protein [Microvirga sp.]